jgi:hypothetical protein
VDLVSMFKAELKTRTGYHLQCVEGGLSQQA